MLDSEKVDNIIKDVYNAVEKIFPNENPVVILFGSYARGDAAEDSDIDLMVLINASREAISEHNWEMGEAAAEMLLKYDVVVSPIVENKEYFDKNSDVLPFYKNIVKEGVRRSA